MLKDGAILWEDSALVRAARLGRVLVVDEAEKVPQLLTLAGISLSKPILPFPMACRGR